MNDNMKPCRLCGSHGQIVIKRNRLCSPAFTTYSVACSFCGAKGRSYFSAHEAIDDWNNLNGKVKRCA